VDAGVERAAILVVGAALGFAVAVALDRRAPAEPVSVVAPDKNPKLVAAGRRGVVAAGLNSRRYRCAECDYTTTAGPLGQHHRRSGHEGRIRV
jgi:hypothetical protein